MNVTLALASAMSMRTARTPTAHTSVPVTMVSSETDSFACRKLTNAHLESMIVTKTPIATTPLSDTLVPAETDSKATDTPVSTLTNATKAHISVMQLLRAVTTPLATLTAFATAVTHQVATRDAKT